MFHIVKEIKQQMQTPKPPFFSIQWLWFSHILPATAELIMTQSIESGIAYAQTCCKKNVLAFSGTSSHGSSKPTTSCSCPSPLGSFFGEPLPTKACTCINMYCYAFCRLCHHSQELVLKQHMWFLKQDITNFKNYFSQDASSDTDTVSACSSEPSLGSSTCIEGQVAT